MRIGFGHVLETFLIREEIWTKYVQQDEQIMTAKLYRRCCQEHRSLRVVSEEPDRLV